MARYTKETLLNQFRSSNPDVQMGDDRLFYNIMKANPTLKGQVEDYEDEISNSYIDYLPNVVKEGYRRSLTGQADELLSGKKRFEEMDDWEPGVLEDIAASAISLMMPTDWALLGPVGKIGGTIGKATLKSFVGAGVSSAKATKAVRGAIARQVGSSSSVFGAYSGMGSALRQKIDTGEINIDEVTEETLKGSIVGAIAGGVGGTLGARGASSITKIAAEVGALGTVGPTLEGQMPTPQDYFHTAGVILGVKGGSKLFSSTSNIKKLFQREPSTEIYKPTKEQAQAIATAEVKGVMDAMLGREKWVSKDKKNRSFSSVNIVGSTSKSYKVKDLNSDKYRNIPKDNFHKIYNRSGEDLGSGTIRQSTEKDIRDYESKLKMSYEAKQSAREKYWGINVKERLKELTSARDKTTTATSKGLELRSPDAEGYRAYYKAQKNLNKFKSKYGTEGKASFLEDAKDGQLYEYKQRLKQEHDIVQESNRLVKEGIEVPVMPKSNFIDNYFPKPIAKMFESLKSPEALAKHPLSGKYISEVMKYQDRKAELSSSLLNQAIAEGLDKNPSRKELSKLGFKGKYKEALKEYWKNMSKRKERGELLEFNAIYDKAYKAAKEAGVDIPGYIPNYLARMIKPEISEILFNDVQTVSSKMVGAGKLMDSFTNTKDWIKKNPEKAIELENIIKKSQLSKEMRRVLKESYDPKKGTLLEAFVDVGKTSYNDLYSVFGNLEKARKLNLPEEFYERDFRKITHSYLYGAAKRIAEVETFGRKGEKFNALRKSVASDGAFKQVDMMNEVHSHVVGTINKDPAYALSPKGKKLAESVMAWETSTKIALGTATIPNTSQFMISSALDAGYWRFIRGVASLASPKVREAIRKSGATEYSMLTELLGTSSRSSIGGKTADFLATYSGFKGINLINQYTAAATARVFMKDLHKIANKSPIKARRQWANDKLNRMGLKSDKPLTEKDITSGTNRYARDMNLQKDVVKDPLIMNNPRAQWFFQFKRFGYRQAKLMDNILRQDLKNGNVLSVIRLGIAGYAGGTGVSIAKKYYKEFLSGEPSFDPSAELPEDFEDLIEGISSVGALGMFGDMLSSAVSVADSPAQAMAFMVSPPVLSSAEGLMDFFIKLEKDAQIYGPDMITRLPSRVAGLLGTVPKELIKRIEPEGMGEERLEGRKSFIVKKINKYLDAGLFDKAYGVAEGWNTTHPNSPISPRSISLQNVFKRMMEREKKKSKNKIRLPEFLDELL